MPRTALMHLLHRVARPLGRRAVLRGLALTPLLPSAGLAATARIAVIGGGLAGLTAAYRLRQAGFRPEVFEAATRLGGRCYTARDVFADGQIAERGGEFIDSGHKEIRALARELGLVLDDVLAATPKGARPFYLFDGGPYTLEEARRDWRPLYKVVQAQAKAVGDFSYRQASPAARRFDMMTIADWVAAFVPGGRAGRLGQLIENAFTEENAADSTQQSALNVIPVLAADPQDDLTLYSSQSDQRFHVRGGNDQIVSRLAARLGGAVVTGTPLVAIARLPDGRMRLSLKRDGAVADAVYDRVILALPFSVLNAAVDTTRAGFRAMKSRAIATLPMGASVKLQLQFERRAWNELGCTGEIRLPAPDFQTSWEVTRAQPGAGGILNFWSGGSAALHAGGQDAAAAARAALQQAAALLPGLPALWNTRMTRDVWRQNPWSLGSYSYYPPGYQTTLAGIEGLPEGNCFFAGEHTASENGYLNAGVSTGLRAAREVAASLRGAR